MTFHAVAGGPCDGNVFSSPVSTGFWWKRSSVGTGAVSGRVPRPEPCACPVMTLGPGRRKPGLFLAFVVQRWGWGRCSCSDWGVSHACRGWGAGT